MNEWMNEWMHSNSPHVLRSAGKTLSPLATLLCSSLTDIAQCAHEKKQSFNVVNNRLIQYYTLVVKRSHSLDVTIAVSATTKFLLGEINVLVIWSRCDDAPQSWWATRFLDPEGGSLTATLVVVVVVVISSLKMSKAFLIRSAAQRNFVCTFVLIFHIQIHHLRLQINS